MKCPSGKTSFESRELAIEALIQNHIRFNHNPGQGPQNVYECGDCGQFHFTSRSPAAQELEDPDVQERIAKERRALQWEQKFRY